jgi:hypothetical protein
MFPPVFAKANNHCQCRTASGLGESVEKSTTGDDSMVAGRRIAWQAF